MQRIDRRKFIGAATSVTLAAGFSESARADELSFRPEPGAKLRLLRWKRFVEGDEAAFARNIQSFSAKYGVEVKVDAESWEDVRPKAAVAANVGSGPDLIAGWFDDPHQYPDKLVDVSDLAEYLGKKYGGWYDVCQKYGRRAGTRQWIAIPWGIVGNALVYRKSQLEAAGFDGMPRDTAGFLKLCQALKAKGTPPGFALGKAVGDGNNWVHWLLWSHGGKLVDENFKVVVNSPQTIAALEYARALYPTFVPGTLSWQDPNNNKAFLDGQISLTANGISIYYSAKNSPDPKLQELAKDIQHARFPIGPIGRPTELMQITQWMVFRHCKFPNAAKELVRFLMEAEQYDPWMQASIGYVSQSLRAYEKNPVWSSDPKHAAYRDGGNFILDVGYSGPLGPASASALADYIVLDMVAEAASGSRSPEDAARRAEHRAKRYYKG